MIIRGTPANARSLLRMKQQLSKLLFLLLFYQSHCTLSQYELIIIIISINNTTNNNNNNYEKILFSTYVWCKDTFLMQTHPHTRTSWPLNVAGLSVMIPPVKCDRAARSCISTAVAGGSFQSLLTNGVSGGSADLGCLTYRSTSRY